MLTIRQTVFFDGFKDLKRRLEDSLLSADLPPIKNNRNKAIAPYVMLKYSPALYNENEKFGDVPSSVFKMNIYAAICVRYNSETKDLIDALEYASTIEKICGELGIYYNGHEEGYALDVLDDERQKDYFLICNMYAYYRNAVSKENEY